MAGSLCSLEFTPGGQLHVKGSQAAVRPRCLGRACLRVGLRRPREPRAWPQQQKAVVLVSRSPGCRGGHRVPDHPGQAWRVAVDRGGVTAAWPGREDWPPLQRDLPAAGSAVRTVAAVTADWGPCGQLVEPGLGPPRGCASRPSMGLGAMCQPGRRLFWQLCIGTNKVHFFTELHPVCVSAYPSPLGGAAPPAGPQGGEEGPVGVRPRRPLSPRSLWAPCR